ncbi:hypothetical protein M514_10074 [Trichuris suis]|uniref:Uncharacterized protein n=1 Tax=Trichuris suis TaxID=68888 RepID=A0A085MU28_9BILA|nr:hypothetical protein M513_10074 [Trichuris suis]KFD60724.1 hypothetical protein M514_10074 [Trichuris suis]
MLNRSKDLFRILTSRDFDQLGPTTHLVLQHIQNFDPEAFDVPPYSTLRSIRRYDKFEISTVRDVNLSNLSTHIALRTVGEWAHSKF